MALKEIGKMGKAEIVENIEQIRLWFEKNEVVQPQLVRRAYMRLLALLTEGTARHMIVSRARCSEHLEVYRRFIYRIDKIEDPNKVIPYENDESVDELYNKLRNVVRICLREREVV